MWGGGKGRELGELQGNTISWSKTYWKLVMHVHISTLFCKLQGECKLIKESRVSSMVNLVVVLYFQKDLHPAPA